ncbi:hypothetical protein ACFVWX_29055 [Streptomyces sp. NPDC058220]|uniref:hypothetical protein n=1 Tax=Streptomyces sp. NPDC058220 TaxID=3346387 RepID=UPI0036ED103F
MANPTTARTPAVSTCTICRRTAPDGTHACVACTQQLRAWYAELPLQRELLRLALLPEGRPAQGRTSGRSTAPVPVNLDALSLLGPGQPVPPADPHGDATGPIPIGALVSGWAAFIAYEYPSVSRDRHGTIRIEPCDGARPTRGGSVAAWCHWLNAYLPYTVTRPWIRDLHIQMGDLMRRIRAITRATPGRRPKTAPCPACDAFGLVEEDWQDHIECAACGHRLTHDAYTAHHQRVMPPLYRIGVLIAARQHTPNPTPENRT